MKLTALLAAACVLALTISLLLPVPTRTAEAEPQYPTLQAGMR